jgi:hypothetical protein
MAALRRLGRRIIGRNGPDPRHNRPNPNAAIGLQRVKTQRAEKTVREAQAAVDAFTQSMNEAMRGQRP